MVLGMRKNQSCDDDHLGYSRDIKRAIVFVCLHIQAEIRSNNSSNVISLSSIVESSKRRDSNQLLVTNHLCKAQKHTEDTGSAKRCCTIAKRVRKGNATLRIYLRRVAASRTLIIPMRNLALISSTWDSQ